MSYQGATSNNNNNNNEITEEDNISQDQGVPQAQQHQYQSNKPDKLPPPPPPRIGSHPPQQLHLKRFNGQKRLPLKDFTALTLKETGKIPSSSTKSGSNNISYEGTTVTIFVAYDGKWEYNGEEWFFKNSKRGIMLDVPKHVTLSQMTDILSNKLYVAKEFYRLKLEVHYRTGSPWFPIIEIRNDQDLSQFISETSKTKVPLCVTDYIPYEERREDYTIETRLLKAIQRDGWVKAREIVNTMEVKWTSQLDNKGNTAFHFAVGEFKDNEVVRDIVMDLNWELLENIVDIDGATPVHTAAAYGNTEALKIMLHSNPKCVFIPDIHGYLAINCAINFLAIETMQYLFKQMKSYENEFERFLIDMCGRHFLRQIIGKGLIDVAYELINGYPSMLTEVLKSVRPEKLLELIVGKPDLFYSGTHYNLCQRFLYRHVPIENNSLCSTHTTYIKNISSGSIDTADEENQVTPKKDKFVTEYTRRYLYDVILKICVKLWETTLLFVPYMKHLKDDKVMHDTTVKLLRRICVEIDRTNTSSDISSPLYIAVENNTPEAIDMLTTYFTELYDSQKDGHNIYRLTVLNRSEKVYIFLMYHKHGAKTKFSIYKDDEGNNILHLAGRLAPIHKLNVASGATLQMQQELQWFEEVKNMVPPTLTRDLNNNKETPIMVFRREHEKLRKDGEEWMKKTADSYTITAALIITIVFAAGITVPGGNDDKSGKPIYETKPSFIIFAVSDAISLFTSTTSLLLFLSILTGRYGYGEFLYNLPKRLIIGLVMLFISVTSMMIAFSAALYIMFGREKQWILIPIGALACLPIASFVKLQFPLLAELVSSTYGPGIFAKENDHWQSSANAKKKKRV